MKLNLICGSMIMAAMFSVTANAQSCASPNTTWTPTPTNPGVPTVTGNTCDASSETNIVSLCGGVAQAYGHAYVLQFTPTGTGTFTSVSLSGVAGFTGYMGVINTTAVGACNGGGDTGACQTSGDAGTPIQHANLTNGTSYYLVVSNSGVDTAASCGAFTLTSDGSLPVSLQNFTVS